jgi:II/X family phage/plasmid replication protein
MIDWLTMLVPFRHAEPLNAGHVVSIQPTGEVEWQTSKRLHVEGSHETRLSVRTATHTPDRCTHLEIKGNPVKFFQGHNLWGTDDLPALAVATCHAVAELLRLPVHPLDVAAWQAGDIRLTCVDATESFHLNSRAEVLAFLRSAEQTAHLAHRGRGQLVKGSTLYFGKNSRRTSLKLYAKGPEIERKGHRQEIVLSLPAARAWADRTLRAELRIHSMELRRLGLDHVRDWFAGDGLPSEVTAKLLRDVFGGMTMTTTANLPPAVLETLRPALRAAVAAWEAGNDLRTIYSKSGFYKFRAELLPLGIDIATRMPREVSNVVPLYRVLEAKPAQVPDWAEGTPLYFEPRRVA